jgi:hypothetical protein
MKTDSSEFKSLDESTLKLILISDPGDSKWGQKWTMLRQCVFIANKIVEWEFNSQFHIS